MCGGGVWVIATLSRTGAEHRYKRSGKMHGRGECGGLDRCLSFAEKIQRLDGQQTLGDDEWRWRWARMPSVCE